MYHIFLIYYSADGYLGCFHVFAIVNSAAVNTEVACIFKMQFYPDIYPEVGLLHHRVLLNLVF